MTNKYRNLLCLIFSQILMWKWQLEEYSNVMNNYLTVSLLLLSYFCEEAVLRQEKYAEDQK